MEGGGLEARPHAQTNSVEVDGLVDVEEARRAAELLEVGLTEGLLQDDIDQVLADVVVLIVEVVRQVDLHTRVLVNHDLCLLSSKRSLEHQGVLQLRESVDRLATDDIGTKSLLEGGLLSFDDVVDTVRLPVFIWLDLQHVLVDASVLAQSQPVLVREEAHLRLFRGGGSCLGPRISSLAASVVVNRARGSLARLAVTCSHACLGSRSEARGFHPSEGIARGSLVA